MIDKADQPAAPAPDRPAAAPTAIAPLQPQGHAHEPAPPTGQFSLLGELAKDPANGLQEIQPGMYVCRKDSAMPDRRQ